MTREKAIRFTGRPAVGSFRTRPFVRADTALKFAMQLFSLLARARMRLTARRLITRFAEKIFPRFRIDVAVPPRVNNFLGAVRNNSREKQAVPNYTHDELNEAANARARFKTREWRI